MKVRLIVFFFMVNLFIHCSFETREEIQTGTSLEELSVDGKIIYRITSTAEASQNAIDKDSYSMKQTTSCEAAKVQAMDEARKLLQTPLLNQANFKHQTTHLIELARYCKKVYHAIPED